MTPRISPETPDTAAYVAGLLLDKPDGDQCYLAQSQRNPAEFEVLWEKLAGQDPPTRAYREIVTLLARDVREFMEGVEPAIQISIAGTAYGRRFSRDVAKELTLPHYKIHRVDREFFLVEDIRSTNPPRARENIPIIIVHDWISNPHLVKNLGSRLWQNSGARTFAVFGVVKAGAFENGVSVYPEMARALTTTTAIKRDPLYPQIFGQLS